MALKYVVFENFWKYLKYGNIRWYQKNIFAMLNFFRLCVYFYCNTWSQNTKVHKLRKLPHRAWFAHQDLRSLLGSLNAPTCATREIQRSIHTAILKHRTANCLQAALLVFKSSCHQSIYVKLDIIAHNIDTFFNKIMAFKNLFPRGRGWLSHVHSQARGVKYVVQSRKLRIRTQYVCILRDVFSILGFVKLKLVGGRSRAAENMQKNKHSTVFVNGQ